jgi:hypothetical protein
MSSIFKPEYIRGNRGRTRQMSWGEATRYNASERVEKGREKAILCDAYGRNISEYNAIKSFGGEDAKYHNAIAAPSHADQVYLEERFGGRESAQHAFAQTLLERTGSRDGLYSIHDHGEKGWHIHLSFKGEPPSHLYGETGMLQKAYDREMELLRGDAGRPITDWEAHARFGGLKKELQEIQKAQRELDRERFRALRNAPADQKLVVRGKYEQGELDLIHRRREVEMQAAEARYQARGQVGCAAHEVEKERVERRAATAVSRMDARTSRQVLSIDRKEAWKEFRDLEKWYKTQSKLLDQELVQVRKQARADLETVTDRADQKQKRGGPEYQKQVQVIDSKLSYEEMLNAHKRLELEATYRRAKCIQFARGPLSRAYLENRESGKLLALAEGRLALDTRWIDKKYQILGTSQSKEHLAELKVAKGRFEASKERISGRASGSTKNAAKAQVQKATRTVRSATRRGARTVTAAVRVAYQEAKKHLSEQGKAAAPKEKTKASKEAKTLGRGAKSTAEAAVKAALRTSAAAAKAAARMTWEAGYAGASATVKMGGGLLLAIPTAGASLKASAKEAGQDLGKGAKTTAQEAGKGAKETGKEAGKGAAQTAASALRGVGGLAEELVPKPIAGGMKASVEAAKTTGAVAMDIAKMDFLGAAKTTVFGALKTAKEASGALVKAAELPMLAKLPLSIAEKIPVVGQLVTIAKTTAEITMSATEIDL